MEKGGRNLLKEYRSLPQLLATAYPEVLWDSERFRPTGSCARLTNGYLLTALDKAAEKLGIQYVLVLLAHTHFHSLGSHAHSLTHTHTRYTILTRTHLARIHT